MAKKHYIKLKSILSKLLHDKHMNARDLSKEVGLPPPTIYRLVNGQSTRPYKSSLKPIAEYFSISVEQLIGEEPLADENDINSQSIELPVYPWNELAQIKETKETQPQQTLLAHNAVCKQCFATVLDDSSMEPYFNKGSTLIFNPKRVYSDRSFVLAKLEKCHVFVFRQLLIDGNNYFLKALNPDLANFGIHLLDMKVDTIIATLVEARTVYEN